jgi:hypothetical protein
MLVPPSSSDLLGSK